MATISSLLPTIIGLFSASSGIICLFNGSFSENQFEDAEKLKLVVFAILALLFGVILLNAKKCNSLLEKVCQKHFSIKALVKLLLLGFASLVNFLIKYPRFNVHSSISDTQRKKISRRSQLNLYSIGSFSVFALVVSSKRQQAMELGLSDFLLGLTMDVSMDIPGKGGPNLWCMLGAYVYCASVIFARSYLDYLKMSKSISVGKQRNIHDLEMVVVTEVGDEEVVEENGNSGGHEPSESNTPKDAESSTQKLDESTNDGGEILTSKKLV